MPYITPDERPDLDDYIGEALVVIESDGQLNYFITRLVVEYYEPKTYTEHQHVAGLFPCLGYEYHRRVVAPYEDTKLEENGDVFNI